MADPGPALCLFDMDGTLTAPRQVGGARRAAGNACGGPCCSQTRVAIEGQLRTAYLLWQG